jgi:hypothetical protein
MTGLRRLIIIWGFLPAFDAVRRVINTINDISGERILKCMIGQARARKVEGKISRRSSDQAYMAKPGEGTWVVGKDLPD